MGENTRSTIGHVCVKTHDLKTPRLAFLTLESKCRLGVGAFSTRACQTNALKQSYTLKCRNRLRVKERAKRKPKKLVCRGLRVGSSKVRMKKVP